MVFRFITYPLIPVVVVVRLASDWESLITVFRFITYPDGGGGVVRVAEEKKRGRW